MAKKNSKAKVENKAEKKQPENKTKIDWNNQPAKVTIVGLGGKHLVKGKEYPNTSKASAEVLIKTGQAKLKS